MSASLFGPGSPVGITTSYGLDGPGIESRWGARFSAPAQTGPGAHPASCTMRKRSFPGVKSGRGVTLTPHPLLVLWSRKGRAITLLPLWARTGCTEPQCLYSTAITLLPLWALTGCTEPQCLYKGALYRYLVIYVVMGLFLKTCHRTHLAVPICTLEAKCHEQ